MTSSPLHVCSVRAPAMRAALAALAALALAASPAMAQSSPWYLGASTALSHDSNLLRLGDNQPPGNGESRSDTLLSTALVGGLNQGIGRQRVTASLTLRDNRFDHNTKYDNQSYNGALGLEWSTVERVSGSLTAGASRNLSTFNADVLGLLPEKNFETTQGLNASLSIGLVTQYSLELGAGHRQVRNSLDIESVQARNYNQDEWSVGVVWRPLGSFSLTSALRGVQGEFPKFSPTATGFDTDKFRQQRLELVAALQPTGASTLDARLSFGETKYVVNTQRDFSNVSGSLGWQWQASGKLRLNTRLSRDEGQDNYATRVGLLRVTINDRRVISTLRLQADWDVAAKLALSSSLQQARRQVNRDTLANLSTGTLSLGLDNGTDTTTIFTFGARWSLWRNAVLGCDARAEKRRATGTITTGLSGNSLNCYGQITIQ